ALSSHFHSFWSPAPAAYLYPAFAGVTSLRLFTEMSKLQFLEKKTGRGDPSGFLRIKDGL
ncbi:MAG: hypothetical protein PVF79_19245, partial [Desulfobacterales bacterium]